MIHQEMVGKRFGSLEIVAFDGYEPKDGHSVYWYKVKCDCGTIKRVSYSNLPRTSSCGCKLRRQGKNSPLWEGHGEISGRVWTDIKNHAANRDLPFEISIEDAWKLFLSQNRKCALTGRDIELNSPRDAYSNRTASLDRIDNEKGYTFDNVQWVHKDINWMKGTFTTKEFLQLCTEVAKYNGMV